MEFLSESHWIRCARDLAGIGLGRAEYLETDSPAIRIMPVRYVGWHGRSWPGSDRPASPQLVSVAG